MKILTFGEDGRARECAALLSKEELGYSSVMLLPIPTTKDGKHLSGTNIPLSFLSSEIDGETLACGYGIPQEIFEGTPCRVCDVSRDEEFLAENARLTAIGALGHILSSSPRAPWDLSFGVVGYGRIGSALVRYLLFFGAEVTVYSSQKEKRLALGELSVESRAANYGAGAGELSDIDILINTAPAPLLSPEDIRKNPHLRIIELASGENFPRDADVLRLMALPSRMYPESAGRAYYRSIMRMAGGAV